MFGLVWFGLDFDRCTRFGLSGWLVDGVSAMKRIFFIPNGERKLRHAIFPLSQQVWVRARERYPARSAAYTLWPRVVMVLRRGLARTPRAIHPLVHTCWSSLHVHRGRNKEHSRACAKGAPYYSSVVSPPPLRLNTTTRNRNDLPLLLFHSWYMPNSGKERARARERETQ